MKIGIDARLWSESGVGRYIRNLVVHLQAIDRENSYVLFAKNGDVDSIKENLRNKNFRIIATDIRWHSIAEQIRFPGVLIKENLDVMHFPYFSLPVFYTKPFLVTVHDIILHYYPTGKASTLPFLFYQLKLFGYKAVFSQGVKKARKIICVSHTVKEQLMKDFGIAKE